MYRIFTALCLGAAGLLTADIAAAEAGSTVDTIYVVSMQQVIDQSIVGKAARSDLQGDMTARQTQLNARKVEIQKLKEDLERQRSLLAGPALADRAEAINRKERDLAQDFDAQREEMSRKMDAQMKKIMADVDRVLQDVAKSHEHLLIVEGDPRLVLYADPKLDITADVIKRLNDSKMSL